MMRLFAALLLVSAVVAQADSDYTYDYYEPEKVVPEPAAPVAKAVVPPQAKAVVTQKTSGDHTCTAIAFKIAVDDASQGTDFTGDTGKNALIAALIAAITRDHDPPGAAASDCTATESSNEITLTFDFSGATGGGVSAATCGLLFKRAGSTAEAQLRIQEASWSGQCPEDVCLASTATVLGEVTVPTVTAVTFTLGGNMDTEIGAYDHDEDYSVTTCNATTCTTVKVHSHRYNAPVAEDDGPMNGASGCQAYPTTPSSTRVENDATTGCYTSGPYNGHTDTSRDADATGDGSNPGGTWVSNAPPGSLDQSWVSSQYRDDDSGAAAAATRSASLTVASWISGNSYSCLTWVNGQWTTVAGRTYAVFSGASCTL